MSHGDCRDTGLKAPLLHCEFKPCSAAMELPPNYPGDGWLRTGSESRLPQCDQLILCVEDSDSIVALALCSEW